MSAKTQNEIVYAESGVGTLAPYIYKRQLKYFRKLKNNCISNPTSTLSIIFTEAMNSNTMFLRHYKKLDESFTTPHECYKFYDEKYKTEAREKIQEKFESDINSILGTYKTLTSYHIIIRDQWRQ